MSKQNTIGTHKTKVSYDNDNNIITVRYHDTDVVQITHNDITLNTGGWFSNTTKLRMNQAANQFNLGFHVYQRNHEWRVDFKGETIPYEGDKLILNRGV